MIQTQAATKFHSTTHGFAHQIPRELDTEEVFAPLAPRKYKRRTPKILDKRKNNRLPASAYANPNRPQSDEGWLTVSDYADKYELVPDTIRQWVKKDILEAKPLTTSSKTDKITAYQVLDTPPDKHPGWARFLSEGRVPGHRGGVRRNIVKPVIEIPDDADLEKRKARLKETYLPRFFEMEKKIPGRIAYTARELKDHLGEHKEDGTYVSLNNNTLHKTWPSWGLRVTPLRNDNPSEFNSEKIKKVGFAIDNKTKLAYKRDDLYAFLSGQWSPKGVNDIDDRLNQQIIGAPTTEDGFYHYDRNRVYPLDAKGFFAWIDDVKPMLRCKLKNDIVPLKLFPWQRKFATEMLKMGLDGRYVYNVGFASAARGEGKCERKGTKLLAYDGKIIKIEEVAVGDLLMGPDSKPRQVLSLSRGIGEMYEIVPTKGEPFVVNGEHILALQQRVVVEDKRHCGGEKRTSMENIEISVNEYLKQGKTFKETTYLYHVPIDWPEQSIALDPYFLGLWLGDGHSTVPAITTPDKEVVEHIEKIAGQYGLNVKISAKPNNKAKTYFLTHGRRGLGRGNGIRGNGPNPILDLLREYNVFGNKHIPHEYKATSRDVRLQLLAGLIDSDGYVNRTGYVITQKRKNLAEDIAFIARSLGFFVSVRECKGQIKSIGFEGIYYKVSISGNCSIIPVSIPRKKVPTRTINKDILRYRIKEIRPVGEDGYYGFTLDKDGLYLHEDFLVTHNSQIIKVIALFRFFNGYAEDIKIAGNSKLEGESVHYDEMRDMITDTPKLINFPGIDLKGKHIVIMKGPKDIFNKIECVPKSSGLHPNMTLGLITELHNYTPQDKKFYNNFLSSRRGTPNAMVLVDSTVEDPGTIIHDEWKRYSAGKLEMTFFFHRDSDDGYENPETTPKYLADEATRYSEDEYRKIYENKWGGASSAYFGAKAIKQIGVAGIDGIYGPSVELSQAIGNMHDLELKLQKFVDTKVKESSLVDIRRQIDAISSRLIDMDDIYRLPASWDDLEKLMKLFGIKAWVIGASVDRASGEQINSDRTAFACVGRGIVDEFTSYYFLLDLFMPFTAESGGLERKLEEWRERYYDVDKTVITEYQGLDLFTWCAKNGFEAEFKHTTYKYQKPLFSAMYQTIHKGYFKSPTVPYYTDERGQLYEGYTNKEDIFTEELGAFRHVSMGDKSGKFGPPDKRKRGGIKDDVVDGVCGAIFACNGEGMEDIARSAGEKGEVKAEIYGNPDLVGVY